MKDTKDKNDLRPAYDQGTLVYNQAKSLFPGGVNSPVRSFSSVGGIPIFVHRAKGAFIWDTDNRKYIDFCQSWGALPLGHSPGKVASQLGRQAKRGTSFGVSSPQELRLGQLIKEEMPSLEKLRFVNSGTEAVMSALRLTRAYTGRSKIVKFDGGYHGHSDSLLIEAGSGVAEIKEASSGVLQSQIQDTISLPYNDISAIESLFKKQGKEIAAVIIEPIAANMGLIPAKPEFLKIIKDLCSQYDALLIFDEVISGFRSDLGGAQKIFGITPDLSTLGKVIGGGLPVGAYGGKSEIMDLIAPLGPVYQAGTLSGNPLAMTAGYWTIRGLLDGGFMVLKELAAYFFPQLKELLEERGFSLATHESIFTIYAQEKNPNDYSESKRSDSETFSKLFHLLLEEEIYISPSKFEANFLSTAHSKKILDRSLNSFEQVLKQFPRRIP